MKFKLEERQLSQQQQYAIPFGDLDDRFLDDLEPQQSSLSKVMKHSLILLSFLQVSNAFFSRNLRLPSHVNEPEEFEGGYDLRLHQAVARGDFELVHAFVRQAPDCLHKKDQHGWLPIHEAVRAGDVDVCRCLIDHGSDIGTKTNSGGTPLWWAKQFHEKGSDMICYLEDIGAPEEHEFL